MSFAVASIQLESCISSVHIGKKNVCTFTYNLFFFACRYRGYLVKIQLYEKKFSDEIFRRFSSFDATLWCWLYVYVYIDDGSCVLLTTTTFSDIMPYIASVVPWKKNIHNNPINWALHLPQIRIIVCIIWKCQLASQVNDIVTCNL